MASADHGYYEGDTIGAGANFGGVMRMACDANVTLEFHLQEEPQYSREHPRNWTWKYGKYA